MAPVASVLLQSQVPFAPLEAPPLLVAPACLPERCWVPGCGIRGWVVRSSVLLAFLAVYGSFPAFG